MLFSRRVIPKISDVQWHTTWASEGGYDCNPAASWFQSSILFLAFQKLLSKQTAAFTAYRKKRKWREGAVLRQRQTSEDDFLLCNSSLWHHQLLQRYSTSFKNKLLTLVSLRCNRLQKTVTIISSSMCVIHAVMGITWQVCFHKLLYISELLQVIWCLPAPVIHRWNATELKHVCQLWLTGNLVNVT